MDSFMDLYVFFVKDISDNPVHRYNEEYNVHWPTEQYEALVHSRVHSSVPYTNIKIRC